MKMESLYSLVQAKLQMLRIKEDWCFVKTFVLAACDCDPFITYSKSLNSFIFMLMN